MVDAFPYKFDCVHKYSSSCRSVRTIRREKPLHIIELYSLFGNKNTVLHNETHDKLLALFVRETSVDILALSDYILDDHRKQSKRT